MRDMLKTQEGMDLCLEQRDEELRQLWSQSQVDGAQLAALSLQMQELISLVESRAKVVGKDLEEINGRFDCHRGEINHLAGVAELLQRSGRSSSLLRTKEGQNCPTLLSGRTNMLLLWLRTQFPSQFLL